MDIVSDFITIIRNGSSAGKWSCSTKWSKRLEGIARILSENGFIKSYEKIDEGNNRNSVNVKLKYVNSIPVITEIHSISTPGCRKYCGVKDIPKILNGMGVVIMSTSIGIMSGFDATKKGVGGEILCYVW